MGRSVSMGRAAVEVGTDSCSGQSGEHHGCRGAPGLPRAARTWLLASTRSTDRRPSSHGMCSVASRTLTWLQDAARARSWSQSLRSMVSATLHVCAARCELRCVAQRKGEASTPKIVSAIYARGAPLRIVLGSSTAHRRSSRRSSARSQAASLTKEDILLQHRQQEAQRRWMRLGATAAPSSEPYIDRSVSKSVQQPQELDRKASTASSGGTGVTAAQLRRAFGTGLSSRPGSVYGDLQQQQQQRQSRKMQNGTNSSDIGFVSNPTPPLESSSSYIRLPGSGGLAGEGPHAVDASATLSAKEMTCKQAMPRHSCNEERPRARDQAQTPPPALPTELLDALARNPDEHRQFLAAQNIGKSLPATLPTM